MYIDVDVHRRRAGAAGLLTNSAQTCCTFLATVT